MHDGSPNHTPDPIQKRSWRIEQMISFVQRYLRDEDCIHDSLTGDPLTGYRKEAIIRDIEKQTDEEIYKTYVSYVSRHMGGLDFYKPKNRDAKSTYRITSRCGAYRLWKKVLGVWIPLHLMTVTFDRANHMLNRKLEIKKIEYYDKYGNKL